MKKHIVAGSAAYEMVNNRWAMGSVVKYALELTKKERPRICFLATATGDSDRSIRLFYDICINQNVQPSHLRLFAMPNVDDPRKLLLEQDVIWVDGGSVINLLAVWREHGIDNVMREAWEKGIVLGGISAGSLCWNIGGTTDSFGEMQPVTNGLGLLPFSSGVHYDSEKKRRPMLHKLIKESVLPDGYATDDGVAIHFIDEEFHKAVTGIQNKFAYKVYKDSDGNIKETKIKPTYLD